MIKKLRLKLVTVLTFILSLVLCGILIAVNIFNYSHNMDNAYESLEKINSNVLQQQQFYYFPNNDRYFFHDDKSYSFSELYIAFVSPQGIITNIIAENNTNYTYQEISDYTKKIISTPSNRGTVNSLIYCVTEIDYGGFGKSYIVGFMDNNSNIASFRTLLITSLVILICGILIIFILSLTLSTWLIKPVEEAFNKQKQFISDASHELKTPIAVISANTDILCGEIGDNKWLGYIKSESVRMNTLVNNLLTLAKIEMQEDSLQVQPFEICNTIMEVTMPFESVAFEKGVTLYCDLEDKITVIGNEGHIKQVIAILTDNAIKHCTEGGYVSVNIFHSKNKCTVNVTNTGEPVPIELQEKIFERFFRADEARNRENNRYGLGLAIAKQIIDNHNGTISVKCEAGLTTFTFTIKAE